VVSFRRAMDKVRIKAMAGFSAASVESYTRYLTYNFPPRF
jgi:hypothetical protein